MLRRWLGARSSSSPATRTSNDPLGGGEAPVTTEDPLAAIDPGRQIYSVSRSVVLPRVALRSGTPTTAQHGPGGGSGGGGCGATMAVAPGSAGGGTG